jgi:hypothetical protein
MLGGSIGIAILETQLTQNTQIVHSRLVEHLRPDNPLARFPYLSAPYSLTDPSGIAALNHEVTRQAAMVAYNDDFALMLIVILASLPLLLLVRGPRRQPMLRQRRINILCLLADIQRSMANVRSARRYQTFRRCVMLSARVRRWGSLAITTR